MMAVSPPVSPAEKPRPRSALMKPPRSNSRLSMSSKQGGSKASDEDIKTSVQVAVRVRPPLRPSDPGFDLIPQRFQKSTVHTTSPTSLAVDSPQGRKLFVFDRVFGEDVQQEGVWDYISGSVDSFLQGYNVSVMAYGQSGAGKSFTMGIVPRAAIALFAKLNPPSAVKTNSGLRNPARYSMNSISAYNWLRSSSPSDQPWQMKATYVEIYNEQLRDLLLPDSVPMSERQTVTIREDTRGRILLTGLHQVVINSAEDLLDALNFGSSIRQTDATAINAKSSRSHAVFSLNLVQRRSQSSDTRSKDKRLSMPVESNNDLSMTVDSKLHFVDLAGSERLKNTGASGERAKEGISINAGLASLGKVISQLSSRSAGAHVSYRDSKLTRLLQDSLGGNAITYMIACVTPAEFHLSETLNTVQYAQRARAIQTKPQIQAVSDEGDKQALIDRLRAEIQFLRDQIRSSNGTGRGNSQELDRTGRQNEREIELQNRLLDFEENYNTLSQRHAKLISDMTKGRENEAQELKLPNGTAGESAIERLKRSTSFAESVEQLVLEYEKTIQSLESSLSKTRSSLSATESSLREKETKCAYADTINQQLQQRVKKLIDRESTTESYVRDLEAKWDGRAAGEERDSVLMTDLRKEISRLRESGNTQEDYIESLEEKLADADKSTELLQREIARLENLVERQRSVGRLDNLLHELDHGPSKAANPNDLRQTSERPTTSADKIKLPPTKIITSTEPTLDEAVNTPLPTLDEEGIEETDELNHNVAKDSAPAPSHDSEQSKFLQEKLEVVNQELIELRVDNENTAADYDVLQAKYDEALRTLATLQEMVDESRREPPSPIPFLSSGGDAPRTLPNGQHALSRSLSSELSSAGHTPDSTDTTEFGGSGVGTPSTPREPSTPISKPIPAKQVNIVEDTPRASPEKPVKSEELTFLKRKYDDLHEQHQDTLDLVEELKAEIQKTMLAVPTSPGLIRRKSSQNLLNVDRANRSLASLENIAAENLSHNIDIKESFEINLNMVMNELHLRSERVQTLETEVAAARKEMETKMTIIAGLTRERSSLKSSSPVDMTMISTMRDQMLQTEQRLQSLQEVTSAREKELLKEISALRDSTALRRQPMDSLAPVMPGTLPETPMEDGAEKTLSSEDEAQQQQIYELQAQIAHWEDKHQIVVESMQKTEKQLLSSITAMEATMNGLEEARSNKVTELEALTNSTAAAAATFELEREKHSETVRSLKKEIESRKETIGNQATRMAELEKAHTQAQEEIIAGNQYHETTMKALDDHREQIASLEHQIEEQQAAIEFHKHGLIRLHDAHAVDVEARRESMRQYTENEAQLYIGSLAARHKEESDKLQEQIESIRKEVQDRDAKIDQLIRQHEERTTAIDNLEKENKTHSRSASTAIDELKEAKARLKLAEEAQNRAEKNLATAQSRVEELQWAKSELNNELDEVREKEQRASRLVEELEGQLHNTFEEGRTQTNRLSQLQSARDQELAEARTAAIKAQEEAASLRSRIEQLEASPGRASPLQLNGDRASSVSSFRKHSNMGSLPSPPPNMPLPPIPTSPRDGAGRTSPANSLQRNSVQTQRVDELESKIKQIEKHLKYEKVLTKTLEEALAEMEHEVNKEKSEAKSWKEKADQLGDALNSLQKERHANRHSIQAIEEAKIKQREAEAARAHLEERMQALSKRKKKNALNCF